MRTYLKKLRMQKKISQCELSEKLGISQNYYSAIENGERQKDLDLSIATKLSEVFGVSIDWIAEQEQKIKIKEGE